MPTLQKEFQFEAKLREKKSEILLKDFVIIGDVNFPQFDPNTQTVLIQDCEFRGAVNIENIDIKSGIKFHSCKFQELLKIYNVKSNEKGIENKYKKYSLIILNCNVNKLVIAEESKLYHGVYIGEETKINQLTFANIASSSNLGNISIENTEVNSHFDIKNVSLNQSIKIINSTIYCKLRILHFNALSIHFSNSSFKKSVFIIGGNIRNGISIEQCEYKNNLELTGIKIVGSLTLKQAIFDDSLKVEYRNASNELIGNLDSIYIFESGFGNSLIVNAGNLPLKLIHIQFSSNVKGIININDCIESKLNFSGVNISSNVIFNNCRFIAILLNQFSNYGNLTFSNSIATSYLLSRISVINSNLGKTQFFSFDFSSFSNIIIIDSLISDILTLNVKWFNDEKLLTSESDEMDYTKRREIYRQIKQSYEKQGDKISSLTFKALELSSFEKELKLNNKSKKFDWWILIFSRTNNYGLNWIKPIFLLTIFTLLFYIFIAISGSQNLTSSISLSLEDIKITLKEIYHYGYIFPQLFNPTRITSRMFGENHILGFWVYFWDMLHRLILAFFIVQTIAAFRKFHEK